MALDDIVFTDGDKQNIILEIGTTAMGNISDILSGNGTFDLFQFQLTLVISSSGITCFAY